MPNATECKRPGLDPALIVVQVRGVLRTAADELGCPEGCAPSREVYTAWARRRGKPTGYQLQGRVGRAYRRRRKGQERCWLVTWTELLRLCGLESVPVHHAAVDAVVRDLRRVSAQLGKGNVAPTLVEYQTHGRHCKHTVYRRLLGTPQGSWHTAMHRMRDFGLVPHGGARRGARPRSAVLLDYRRECLAAGLMPGGPGLGMHKFEGLVGYRFHSRFGVWADLVRDAGYVPRSRPAQFARVQTEAA